MTDMVERVCRAIYESQIGVKVPDHLWPIAYGAPAFKSTVDSARAAIEAMRLPTAAMVDAADRSWFMGANTDPERFPRLMHLWQVFIDAALKEAP